MVAVIRERKIRPWSKASQLVLLDFHLEEIAELFAATDDRCMRWCGCGEVIGRGFRWQKYRTDRTHTEQMPLCGPMPVIMVRRLCATCREVMDKRGYVVGARGQVSYCPDCIARAYAAREERRTQRKRLVFVDE